MPTDWIESRFKVDVDNEDRIVAIQIASEW